MTIQTDRPGGQTDSPIAHFVRRGEPGYDAVRIPWNFAVDQRPAVVATPHTVAEVAALVRWARSAGLRIAPQSTGHNAGPLAAGGLDDVVLLRTCALRGADIDVERRSARVEGGALWLPVVEQAAESGLAALHGSSPDTGIVGYSLGGGLSWYARLLGLAAHSVTAVELVDAEGTLVRADADENASLFWALRGGGAGNFGVVTALEFDLHPIRTVYAGALVWDIGDAERVLRRWAAWAPQAPDEVTTSFRILRLPPVPEVPAPFRGRAIVMIDGAVVADDTTAARAIAELRALEPELDTFARVPAATLPRLHMDPEGGAAGVSDTVMLRSLGGSAIDELLELVGPGAHTPVGLVELRQLGGAVGRPHPGAGVLTHLDGEFLALAGAMAMDEEMAAHGLHEARRLTAALAPVSSGRCYLNFAENPVVVRDAFTDDTWLQLKGVRSAVDPHGTFLANHPVPRLFENARPTA